MSGQTGSLKKTLTRFSTNMLVRTILLPSVFTSIPEDQASLYNSVISLLQNLEKNGVILIDDNNFIKTAMSEGVDKWPLKFRKPALVLLEQLKKKNRLVELSLNSKIEANCIAAPCHNCIRMAKVYLPPAIIASDKCNQCANKQLTSVSTVDVVDVAEYSISKFFNVHLNQRDRLILNSEWKQDKFEQEILIPLFRDAKHIKIYDRWIGRSFSNPPHIGQIGDNYKLTLEWILDVFIRKSRLGIKGIFEVCSGLDTLSISKAKIPIPIFVASIRQFESDIRTAYSFPNFKVTIKKETQRDQMLHQRYLITNQVAVSIDRGFDLLLDKRTSPYPRRVRDVTIAYCSEPGKIEKAVRSLPDLP
ncbi:hypothetical protein H6F77_19520 [Microcoleus sp. FACHB-831]|uniref:hypothetical protein n=1 Tax=Microcoleus sp. FACHB-831 TaxID=2692827 RepID=UPI001689A7FF|nr:hypothetical protein [Microcoleus sp. FACHB-831]MBD1923243.1 hypothetical protein [Microcoleus sp. FACHB-831]